VRGFYLEFESPPGFLLKLQSLENLAHGIELAATRHDGRRQLATVFVPHGQLTFFIKRVEEYATRLDTRSQRPKHQRLVESIYKIRLAVAESFWTDPPELLPPRDSVVWWEAWLRGDTNETRARFERIAQGAKLELADEIQTFPERTVVLVRASLLQLASTLEALDMLAELRRVKQIGSFFMRLGRPARSEWLADLRSRVTLDATTSVAVTILDSGIQRSHPLLAPLLAASDMHAWLPAWRAEQDHDGHGTEMAGIAAHGDLAQAMLHSGPISLTHRLESVKIVPPQGQNPEHLYGRVTADGVRKAEIQAPERSRIFSIAIAADAKDHGLPTAWSAEIDKLAAGVDDEERRLFFVCAGNISDGVGKNYPAQNLVEGIHDPGQSWNAVTVGAYTALVTLDDPKLAGWSCVAPPGCISPSSTTSVVWESKWPLKPDFVMEGGNMAVSPAKTDADAPDSLSILTTYFRDERPFTSTGDTSAATAAAARYAALLRAQYPELWPESIRALLVDSAEWTPAMQREIRSAESSSGVELALRCFGFGVPKLERALWSAGNALTLIAQDELQPFTEDKSNEMNLHALPWPSAELEQLGDVEVELRVTLSYFIEPNRGGGGGRTAIVTRRTACALPCRSPTNRFHHFANA
jgi:Subtilase family